MNSAIRNYESYHNPEAKAGEASALEAAASQRQDPMNGKRVGEEPATKKIHFYSSSVKDLKREQREEYLA